MKINNISLYNFTTPDFETASLQNAAVSNSFDYNKSLHPSEVLGRSQVNFAGNSFKFSENDRKFIDVVAANIRMSEGEKKQFENAIADYLKERNLTSLDDISGDEYQKEQGEFIEVIGEKLEFMTDMDFDIFTDELIERTGYEDDYEPSVDKYRKDFEVVDYILDKYNMDEGSKTEVFDVLEMEATRLGNDTIFDIFKDNPERPKYLFDKYLGMNDDLLTDVLIDFCRSAQLDAKERHAQIDADKLTAKFNMQLKDYAITSDFIEEFGLDNNNDVYIMEQLQRRREGVKPEQIAYELTDKLGLSSKAYQYLLETVYNFDTSLYDEEFS